MPDSKPTSFKSITVNITVVIALIMSLSTTAFNVWNDGKDQQIADLKQEIVDIKAEQTRSNEVLHRRISDNSTKINSLEINLAGWNATLVKVESDLSEVKSDIKELVRNNGDDESESTTIQFLLEELRRRMAQD